MVRRGKKRKDQTKEMEQKKIGYPLEFQKLFRFRITARESLMHSQGIISYTMHPHSVRSHNAMCFRLCIPTTCIPVAFAPTSTCLR